MRLHRHPPARFKAAALSLTTIAVLLSVGATSANGASTPTCALARGPGYTGGCFRPHANIRRASKALVRETAPNSAVHYYLSLGDSFAVGVQPVGDGGQDIETGQGYPDQLYSLLLPTDPKLQLVKLGCGGESTESMLIGSIDPSVGSSCGPPDFYLHRYPHKTQLAEAVAFLHAHRDHVSLVTIDIGGNDVLHGGGVPAIQANLPLILGALREAAGPDVPIVGMTYYDPLLALIWFTTFDLVALQAEANVNTLNGSLEGIYASYADPIARIDQAFSNNDTTFQPDGLPLDVDRICAWTWTCAAGDIHPNTQGYHVIANTYLNALP